MSDSPDLQPPDAEARRRRWTEFAATVLLAFGSAVTSWSAYQASLWSGVQATNYNQATARRVESTQEATEAGQFWGVDVAMFMGWANAYVSGNDRLQQFYRTRFRPEFRQAFETWLATDPMTESAGTRLAFRAPELRIATPQTRDGTRQTSGGVVSSRSPGESPLRYLCAGYGRARGGAVLLRHLAAISVLSDPASAARTGDVAAGVWPLKGLGAPQSMSTHTRRSCRGSETRPTALHSVAACNFPQVELAT